MFAMNAEAMSELFREEIHALGGRVSDQVSDGRRLFARSLLPDSTDVVAGDRVKPGVALRSTEEEIEVRPYVFRTICRNGAIVAHSGRGCRIPAWGDATEEVRQAIRDAAAPAAFEEFVGTMRASRGRPVQDLALALLSAGAEDLDPAAVPVDDRVGQ